MNALGVAYLYLDFSGARAQARVGSAAGIAVSLLMTSQGLLCVSLYYFQPW